MELPIVAKKSFFLSTTTTSVLSLSLLLLQFEITRTWRGLIASETLGLTDDTSATRTTALARLRVSAKEWNTRTKIDPSNSPTKMIRRKNRNWNSVLILNSRMNQIRWSSLSQKCLFLAYFRRIFGPFSHVYLSLKWIKILSIFLFAWKSYFFSIVTYEPWRCCCFSCTCDSNWHLNYGRRRSVEQRKRPSGSAFVS